MNTGNNRISTERSARLAAVNPRRSWSFRAGYRDQPRQSVAAALDRRPAAIHHEGGPS